MTTRKPTLPPSGHISIAHAVTEALAGAAPADVESLPTKVRDSLDYFTEVSATAERIENEQPAALTEYRDDLIALFLDSYPAQYDPDLGENERQYLAEDRAKSAADTLLSSHLLARLLADTAVGNVEPVATTPKSTPARKAVVTLAKTPKPAAAPKPAAPRGAPKVVPTPPKTAPAVAVVVEDDLSTDPEPDAPPPPLLIGPPDDDF